METQVKKKPAKKNSVRTKKLMPLEEYAKSIRAEDFAHDPFFKKKADDSKAFLEKHGFPKELLPPKK